MIQFNIAKMRILILYSMFIWVLSFLLGVVSIGNFEISKIPTGLESMVKIFVGNNSNFGIALIAHNLEVILIMIIGAFSLGMTTFINLTGNGFGFGMLVCSSIKAGASVKDIILLTVPHGIFELPALWLASSAGFKGTDVFIRYIKSDNVIMMEDIVEFLFFSISSIVLIIIAGVIEIEFTYRFMKVVS